ncbi:hypothetical protein F4774DRAFT_411069 [Daldinia eschscholtzii]|nr:hypothetical protein F4774DRAFT_411069 [Daldinia eschscholtzii]
MVDLDVPSFYALITSCRMFYDAYKSDKGVTLYKVTINALGSTFPLAIALQAAIRSDWTGISLLNSRTCKDDLLQKIHKFGHEYLDPNNKQTIRPEDLSLRFAWEITSFHSIVERFAREFTEEQIAAASRKLDASMEWSRDGPARPATSTELSRVQSALYYMEISRVLLPDSGNNDHYRLPRDMLWHYSPPWDIATTYGVCRFLDRRVYRYLEKASDVLRNAALGGGIEFDVWYLKIGLRGIDRLTDEEFGPGIIDAIESTRVRFGPSRCFLPAPGWGCTWLRPVEKGSKTRSLDIDHILARFPREDDGPCINWYHNIMIYSDMGRRPRPWKIAWWDLARTHEIFGDTSGIEEIKEMARGKVCGPSDKIDYCKVAGYY